MKITFSKSHSVGIAALLEIKNSLINQANNVFNQNLAVILEDYGVKSLPPTSNLNMTNGIATLEWEDVPPSPPNSTTNPTNT